MLHRLASLYMFSHRLASSYMFSLQLNLDFIIYGFHGFLSISPGTMLLGYGTITKVYYTIEVTSTINKISLEKTD